MVKLDYLCIANWSVWSASSSCANRPRGRQPARAL